MYGARLRQSKLQWKGPKLYVSRFLDGKLQPLALIAETATPSHAYVVAYTLNPLMPDALPGLVAVIAVKPGTGPGPLTLSPTPLDSIPQWPFHQRLARWVVDQGLTTGWSSSAPWPRLVTVALMSALTDRPYLLKGTWAPDTLALKMLESVVSKAIVPVVPGQEPNAFLSTMAFSRRLRT